MKTKLFYLTHNCIAAIVLALLLPSRVQAVVETYNTVTNLNWTCPAGVTNLMVECWGGGGAGGAPSRLTGHAAGGGGGAAGAYAMRTNVPVTPGGSYNITIPGSAQAPAGTADGVRIDGTNVTFTGDSGVTVTAVGGQGGQSKQANGATATGLAGIGSTTGCVGDVFYVGGSGGSSSGNGGGGGGAPSDLAPGTNAVTTTLGAGATGSDANHNGGAGGAGRTGNSAGGAGSLPAGGGGGGKVTPTGSTQLAGGTGGRGQLILTYTVPVVNTVKANNTLDLTNSASWTAGVPSAVGVAKWDSTVTGPNTVSLGADTTFGGIVITNPGGPITINAGNTLTLGTEAIDIDMTGATVDLTLNGELALGGPNVWDVASGRTLNLGGVVSGSQAVTKQGAGKVVLSATNTYSGATTISAGTLRLNAADIIRDGASGSTVTVNANGTLDLNGNSEVLSALNVNGGIVDSTAAGTPTLTIGGNNGNMTINGTVQNSAGSLTLVKEGSGSLIIAGTNTYGGGTMFNAGVLNVSKDVSLGSGSIFVNGTRLSLGGGVANLTNSIIIGANNAQTARGLIESSGGLTTTNIISGPIAINSGVASGAGHFAAFNGTLDIRSVITSSVNVLQRLGPIIYSGGGTGYSDLFVSDTAQVGANNGIATTATVKLGAAAAGTLDLNGFNQSLAGITKGSAAGTVTNGSSATTSALTLTGTSIYAGTLVDGAGLVSLTVNSSGTVTLSGANTYSAGTIINAGTLLVTNITGSGTGSGTVTINSGGTLGGIGSIDGAVTNNTGGTLAPGETIGTLTLNGDLVLNAGSTNTFEVDGTTPANDTVVLGAAVIYGGVLNIVTNGAFTNGQTFTLFSGAGATTAGNFASIAGSPGAGLAFSFTNGVLSVVAAASPVSSNAYLTSFILSPAGTLSPTFGSNVFTYTATNAYGGTPTVTVVNADLTATNQLIYNGTTNALASGVASSGLALTLGVNNPVVVRVTAQDGITVQSYTVNLAMQPSQTAPKLTNSVSGTTLSLSWPASHLGYTLQQQTNSRSVGLSNNWVAVPGSASVTSTNIPIDATKPTVFYRLVYP